MPRFSGLCAVGLAALLGACGGGESGEGQAPAPPPASACPDGQALGDGVCEPILPASPCAAGSRAVLGQAVCQPVGPAVCAAGFERHASGWGCVPVLPKTACTGATRDALGQTSCVPVGDCGAAFPPAGIALAITVDATLAVEDATHKKTLAAALAAASAGATIGVLAGTYAENLTIDKPVSIVGRCAAQVTVDAASSAAAFDVQSAALSLRGVTIRGGLVGVRVVGQTFEGRDLVLEQNLTAGAIAFEKGTVTLASSVVRGTVTEGTTNGVFADRGSTVTLTDTAIAGAAEAGVGATGSSTITLLRSIVRDTIARPDGAGGSGVRAFEGAHVTLTESAVVASRGTGIIAGKSVVEPTHAAIVLTRSSVDATTIDPRYGSAIAASITDGASLTTDDSTFADNAAASLVVSKAGTSATLRHSAVVATTADGEVGAAAGVVGSAGAKLEVDASVVVATAGTGIFAEDPGTIIALNDSLLGDTSVARGGPVYPKGRGGEAIGVIRGGTMTVKGSTIEGSHGMAAIAGDSGSKLSFVATLLRHTDVDGLGDQGHAIVGETGARIEIVQSYVADNSSIGIAFSGATGLLSGSFVEHNAVGIQVQGGSSLVQGTDAPQTVPALTVFVTSDTIFLGNASQVGSGEVPLPTVLAPTPP